jgi:hypothetical protein
MSSIDFEKSVIKYSYHFHKLKLRFIMSLYKDKLAFAHQFKIIF